MIKPTFSFQLNALRVNSRQQVFNRISSSCCFTTDLTTSSFFYFVVIDCNSTSVTASHANEKVIIRNVSFTTRTISSINVVCHRQIITPTRPTRRYLRSFSEKFRVLHTENSTPDRVCS